MKHSILRKLMLIAVLLTSSQAFAHDFEVDGIYYKITDNTATVTHKGPYGGSYDNEYTGSVVIPETVTYNSKTYPVTSIGSETFRYCKGVTSVIIPNSVTYIGEQAFELCRGLTSVTIPNSVINISRYAFSYCSGLTSITIPNSVTYIGDYTFMSCSGLTSLTIGNSVKSIGKDPFYSCTSLTSIVVESSNTVYDSRDNCNAIIETETNTLILGCENTIIPNSVTSIGEWAFAHCNYLTSITIPNSITSIGENVFTYCHSLTEIISRNTTPPTAYNSTFNNLSTRITLYVPIGSRDTYANATGWNCFTNIKEKNFSSIESTLTDNDVNVYAKNGNIIVNGAENTKVEVYSTNGQCIYNGTATTIPVSAKGLYIVKVNNESFKVIL